MTQVTATPTAADLIAELKAEYGELIFYLSGGCCGGSAPMCFPKGDFMIGNVGILLATLCDCDMP